MRKLLLLPALLLLTGIIVACEDEKHTYVANVSDPEKTPTMRTEDVSTLISDSGYTRYKITSPVWNIFDDAQDPHWTFPDGLSLEQYDLAMKVAANMDCDSATYFSNKRLWRLDGNVVMVNVQRDSFLTQQLFWDQNANKLYSDSFIHIVKAKHIIEGYGFVSNQEMTQYSVNRPTAIIPINSENAPGHRAPQADTTMIIDTSDRPMPPERASRRFSSPFITPVNP